MPLNGMDVESVLGVAQRLNQQAARLEQTLTEVDRLVSLAGRSWQGAGLDQFRARWRGQYRRTGLTTAAHLRDLSTIAGRNADAQRRTSATLDGGASGSTLASGPSTPPAATEEQWWQQGLDRFGDRADDVLDAVHAAGHWVDDRVDDAGRAIDTAGHWVVDRVDDAGRAIVSFVQPRIAAFEAGTERYVVASGILSGQLVRWLEEGRVPQASEVVAASILVAGTGLGAVANIVTGEDLKFLDPGKPWAGSPSPTIARDGHHPPITDFNSLTQSTMDVYDRAAIRVDAVTGADGVTRYVVAIPGTMSGGVTDIDSWRENTNALNWGANLYAMAQGSAATDAQAVWLAMRNAGIRPGSEVLLSAHSQGGIIATNLAADPRFAQEYQVAAIVAYGAPVECADFSGSNAPPVLSFQHGNEWVEGPLGPYVARIGDVVPQVDLGGLDVLGGWGGPGRNITTIDLPTQGDGWFEIDPNHRQSNYITDVSQHLTAEQQQAVADFETANGLSRFYTTPGTTPPSVRVEIAGRQP